MVSRAALILMLLAAAAPAASQTTPRAIAEIADISGLAASPDGQWIAYRLERPSTVTNRIDVDWYLVRADGRSPPRSLGRTGAAMWDDAGTVTPGEARWAPDSRSLVVRALVDGRVGLWQSGIDGSGFQEIVAGDGDIEAFAMLPDGALIASEGPSRAAIARAEEAERETGILADGRVDLAGPLFRGSLVNGRPATQRFTEDWFERKPLLAGAPRTAISYDLATGTARPAADTEMESLAPVPDAAPTGTLRAALEAMNVCLSTEGCADEALRLSSHIALADGRMIVTLRDRAYRQSLFLLPANGTRLAPLLASPGLLAGSRDERSPCAATAAALFCVEASPATPPRLVRVGLDGQSSIIDAPNNFPDSDGLLAETLDWQVGGSRASGVLIRPKIPGRLPLFVTYYRCPGFVRGGLGDEYPLHALAAHGIATLCINVQPRGETSKERYEIALQTITAAIATLDNRGLVDRAKVGMGGLSFGSEVTMWTASHSRLLKAAAIASVHVTPAYYWFNARPGRENFADNLRRHWKLGPPDEDVAAWKQMSSSADIGAINAPILMQLPENEMRQSIELVSKLATARMGELHVFPLAPHIKVEPRQKLAVYERNLDWFRYWLKDEVDPDPAKSVQYERWRRLGPKKDDASIDRTQRSASVISSKR
jgi:dipeptidyl aminopeptidase/acylaminoacyl peptidase